MHRADLLATLVGALPPERLHVGHRFTRWPTTATASRRRFENGTRSRSTCWSAPTASTRRVREVLFGPERPRLHRLRRLPRAGARRAPAPPRPRGDRADLDGPGQPLRPLLRAGRAPGQLRGGHRAGHLDARVVDRPRRARPTRSPPSRAGIRSCDEILGAVDETFIWALFDRPPLPQLVARPRDAARRRVPPDAALHGPGRGAGDRGRRHAHGVPGREPTSPRRCAATRSCALPRASRIQALSTENKTRFHLPDGERQRERDALMAGGGDRLRHQRRRVDLRARRGRRRRRAARAVPRPSQPSNTPTECRVAGLDRRIRRVSRFE